MYKHIFKPNFKCFNVGRLLISMREESKFYTANDASFSRITHGLFISLLQHYPSTARLNFM